LGDVAASGSVGGVRAPFVVAMLSAVVSGVRAAKATLPRFSHPSLRDCLEIRAKTATLTISDCAKPVYPAFRHRTSSTKRSAAMQGVCWLRQSGVRAHPRICLRRPFGKARRGSGSARSLFVPSSGKSRLHMQ
jgi:hypothetical protein